MNETPWNRDGSSLAPSKPSRLIVWERDGSWARHLRRLLAPDSLRVYEVRNLAACREMIAESPASIVVALWTTSTSDELLSLVARLRRDYSATRTIVVADRCVEPWRWQVLELGVVWLCTSPRELKPVLGIVQRHVEQVPKPSRSPEQRIWDELPWNQRT